MSFSLSLYLNAQTRRTADLRAALESENTQSANEEMGKTSAQRPDGTLVWLHAPNVAKALTLTKLIREFSEDWQTVSFLLTTPKSAKTPFTVDVLPSRCTHQFAPAEAPEFVENFLNHWAPDIAVFMGIDVAPLPVFCAESRKTPLFLIDVKLDSRTFGGLRDRMFGQRTMMKEILQRFSYIDVADAASAKALLTLGIPRERLQISGPMQEVSATLPCNEEDRNELAKSLVGRPVWFACNIPVEEDEFVLSAHIAASRTALRLLLIVVPDISLRGPDLAAKFSEAGIRVRLRSLGEVPDEETQVYIADTNDERGLWYRLATVSFLGSSLATGHKVQTPFEAAGLGSAILHGPNLGTHREVFEALNAEGGARQINSAAELTSQLVALLAPDQSAAMAHSAWDLATKGARATDLAVSRLESMLEEVGAF